MKQHQDVSVRSSVLCTHLVRLASILNSTAVCKIQSLIDYHWQRTIHNTQSMNKRLYGYKRRLQVPIVVAQTPVTLDS